MAARWVIERSNAWMERCKILVKNFERTLANATDKVNLCSLFYSADGSEACNLFLDVKWVLYTNSYFDNSI
ncbi:MAG: transposase [Nodularia sp. (in: cyanobacteria)]|nr:transposase [Nodularia sp. (in: cyanobacteria)]